MQEPTRRNTAVFVDQSGRRSRILTATAIGSGALVVVLLLVVVTGVLGGTDLPGLGWPGKGPGAPAVQSTPSPRQLGGLTTPRPGAYPVATPPGTTAPGTPSSSAPSPSATQPRKTPTAPPKTPGQGKTPPASPGPPTDDNPGHGGTPPGQADKTHGPR
ncbi:hypothetical protein ACFFHJ_30095 [Planotetraspora thailandica]|uniref:hypothetical protein n=1 Tax=Planotetraspora thailandica TaxID=487172 RepID=UPI0019512A6E|nr:hypothetical protein [Planotetraspora thailandica]